MTPCPYPAPARSCGGCCARRDISGVRTELVYWACRRLRGFGCPSRASILMVDPTPYLSSTPCFVGHAPCPPLVFVSYPSHPRPRRERHGTDTQFPRMEYRRCKGICVVYSHPASRASFLPQGITACSSIWNDVSTDARVLSFSLIRLSLSLAPALLAPTGHRLGASMLFCQRPKGASRADLYAIRGRKRRGFFPLAIFA